MDLWTIQRRKGFFFFLWSISQPPRDKLCFSSEKMTKNLYCAFKKSGRLGSIERWEQLTHSALKKEAENRKMVFVGVGVSFERLPTGDTKNPSNSQMWQTFQALPGSATDPSRSPQIVSYQSKSLWQTGQQFCFQGVFHTFLPANPWDRSFPTSQTTGPVKTKTSLVFSSGAPLWGTMVPFGITEQNGKEIFPWRCEPREGTCCAQF